MREILFRGKNVDGGEWKYGHYVFQYGCKQIYLPEGTDSEYGCDYYHVDPATVGQYTGLTDKNGKKIFEGDIVRGKDALIPEMNIFGYISHENGSFVIIGNIMHHYRWLDYDVEVIGNIHDNPELLEEEE